MMGMIFGLVGLVAGITAKNTLAAMWAGCTAAWAFFSFLVLLLS